MKKRIYSVVSILVLVLLLFIEMNGSCNDYTTINDEEVPLASGVTTAYFFKLDNNNISTKSILSAKYIGNGKVNDVSSSSDIEEIQTMIDTIPDCSKYLGDNQRMEWINVKKTLGKWNVYGYPVDEGQKLYSNVEDMTKDNSLSAGMEVQTKGYYVEGVGAGTYLISDADKKADGGTVIALENGLSACLKTDGNTVDVTQFGAYADGMHNDSKAIENALNAGISTVTFSKGEYKCCNVIKMKQNNVRVIGNNSILFTDNDYQTQYYEWFFNIIASNIEIDGLQFEARETITPQRKSQMGIMYASDITIKNCIFNIPDTVLSDASDKNCEYTNLDIYTSWKNVKVDNCKFYDMADCLAGGCLEIRDIKGFDCDGCTFTNNVCYANNHDEIIGVFCLSDNNRISNVTIKNSKFYQENTTMYGRAVGLSLGYSGNHGAGANNLVFEDNYYEGYSHFEFIKFGMSQDVVIKNNTLICNQDGLEKENLCLFRCSEAGNVVFESNDIQINEEPERKITAIVRGSVKFNNNKVTCNSEASNILFEGIAEFCNNELVMNKAFTKQIISTSFDGVQINGNKVKANNWGDALLYFIKISNLTATKDIMIKNNELTLHNKSKYTSILSFSELDMKDSVVYCDNNVVIDDDEKNATEAYLCKGTLINKLKDQIVLCNNNTGALNRTVIDSK